MATINFREVLNEELKNPEFKRGYDALEDEFKAIDALIEARSKAGLTQAQIAKKMGVSQPVIARIESGAYNIKYKTFLNYIKACGKRVAIV
ncbi:helix-turn-helix domain-containing protein [Campylobacter sp. 7477a]|uniref:helix-turn-helix domain-containing protein n=1 Tax=Campylobacter sp. 7477a TaxID=2735741 RepID=UPI003014BC85|nr:helix-turn-helix transcriptional regulator [Campylobacter sp. 7477a]